MRDYEDVSKQADRVTTAELELRNALTVLATCAKREAKARTPDIDSVIAPYRIVREAEETLDLARLDLATARGEDA